MRKVDFHQLEKASDSFAKAIFDPDAWPEVMDEICAGAGATGAVLLQSDNRTRDAPRTRSIDDLVNFYFNSHWHLNDLRVRGLPLLERGAKVFTDQDCISHEAMRRSEFYNDFVWRAGFEWFAGIGFYAGSDLWVLALQRSKGEGAFERSDTRILGNLSDRLTQTATLAKAAGHVALSSATNALDSVGQAALTLDKRGLVIDANAAAAALFGDSFRVHNRRLVLRDKIATSNLERLADELGAASAADTLSAKPFVIRREAKAPILVRVLPISGPARSAFVGARALLTLTELRPEGPDPTDISRVFGLTKSEAKLASLIAAGLSLEDAGIRLGISTITARHQLKAGFAKTGTHRQSALVALLSRL